MLTKLSICGFQCHKKTELDLKKITVLVGENDVGKSAVIRALKFLVLNEWEGTKDELITWGEDSVTVTGTFEGKKASRCKGGTNSYAVDGVDFPSFGTKVPPPVAAIFNMGPENFQNQHDAAFWLSLSSGQAASALNGIFNLTAIDDSLSNAAAELRTAKSKTSICTERLASAQTELDKLFWMDAADEALQELESLWQEIEDEREEKFRLDQLWLTLTEAEREQKVVTAAVKAAEAMIAAAEEIVAMEGKLETLKEITRLEDELCQTRKTLKAKQTKLEQQMAENCPLCGR